MPLTMFEGQVLFLGPRHDINIDARVIHDSEPGQKEPRVEHHHSSRAPFEMLVYVGD